MVPSQKDVEFPTVYCPKETKYTLNGKFGATTSKLVLLIFLMPYAFPDAPQSIAIAQTCLLEYEIGKETVAGFDEFSLDNPHCLFADANPVNICNIIIFAIWVKGFKSSLS